MNNKAAHLRLLAVIVVGITLAVVYREAFDATALESWVKDAGAAGPVLGTLYNLTGATLGATLAFIVARYLASNCVEQKTGGRLRQKPIL